MESTKLFKIADANLAYTEGLTFFIGNMKIIKKTIKTIAIIIAGVFQVAVIAYIAYMFFLFICPTEKMKIRDKYTSLCDWTDNISGDCMKSFDYPEISEKKEIDVIIAINGREKPSEKEVLDWTNREIAKSEKEIKELEARNPDYKPTSGREDRLRRLQSVKRVLMESK